jgi:acyl dehydratase
MQLVSRGQLIGVRIKRSGTTIVARTETRTHRGALLNEQYMTGFYRGVQAQQTVGVEAPGHASDVMGRDPVATITYRFDEDQTFRYAEASGDHNPFHLDDEVARSLGLPGMIIHGLCTMAFMSRAVVEGVCEGDSTRLRRLALRFSNVALPGQEITTRIWSANGENAHATYAFEATNAENAILIKDGLAEVDG